MVEFQNFNDNFGEVYNMIQEQRNESCSDEEMPASQMSMGGASKQKAKKEVKSKGGFFGKIGDQLSAALYKGSKQNATGLSNQQQQKKK